MKEKIMVVGIGASAGGLSAINEFFDNITANTGMAFIVIQHLSPDFKSMMDELLIKHTHLPVQVIKEDTEIKPNHIYLISKERNIIIDGNFLRTVARKGTHEVNLPIDEFFHSLGTEKQNLGIGIILSGTGTDGSRGIKTIKEKGGTVLVQDPNEAQFDGMPNAAIETGMVDDVLTAAELGKTIMKAGPNPSFETLLYLNLEDPELENYFDRIIRTIEGQTGVNFAEYRRTTLYRRIEKRMFLTNHRSLEAFLKLLETDPKEVDMLYKEFLIGVTRFFRDAQAFDIINEKVIPAVVRNKGEREQIRIWVPGCSFGEEAYSLAILFNEYLTQNNINNTFKIFASDLDSFAISQASKGVFKNEIAKDIKPALLKKYFEKKVNGRFVIQKEIREKIIFTVHDALSDPPFINTDLVSCRNLLIYLKPDIQQKLLISFQFSLNYLGYLFLGPSESLGNIKSAFNTINDRWNIFQNRLRNKLNPTTYSGNRPRKNMALHTPAVLQTFPNLTSNPHLTNEEFFMNQLLQKYAPLSLFVDPDLNVLYSFGEMETLFHFPMGSGRMNLEGIIPEAELLLFRNGVRQAIESNQPKLYKNVLYRKKDEDHSLNVLFDTIKVESDETVVVRIEIRFNESDDKNIKSAVIKEGDFDQEKFQALRHELKESQAEKRLLVQKLETTNEELQSTNEELLASNEELQSTNEELQSVNEELYTVNSELQEKVTELSLANTDMDNLLKSTEIGTIFVDEQLRIRKFTPAITKNLKLVPLDIGRPITAFVNNFNSEDIYNDLKKVVEMGSKIEKEVSDRNGNHFLMRVLPYEVNGLSEGAVITFVDINDIVENTREVTELAKMFHGIFTNSRSHIFIMDKKGVIQDVNFVADGYDVSSIVGKNMVDVLPESSRESFAKFFDQAVREDRSMEFKDLTTLKDGEVKLYKNVIFPVSTELEGVTRVLMISKDETTTYEIENEFRQRAAIFKGIYNHGDEHILITDADGNIIDVNYTDLGYQKSDIIGKNIFEIPASEENSKTTKRVLDSIKNGSLKEAYETEVRTPNGEIHLFENIVFPTFNNNRIESIVFLVRNISRFQRATNGKDSTT